MKSRRPVYRPSINVPWARWFADERTRDLRAMRDTYAAVQHAYLATPWSRPDALDTTCQTLLELVTATPPHAAVTTCLARLLAAEEVIFAELQIDWKTSVLSLQEQTNLNRFLRARRAFLANQDRTIDVLADSFTRIAKILIRSCPKPPQGAAIGQIPLYASVADLAAVLTDLIGIASNREAAERGVLLELHHRLYENLCKASGLIPFDYPHKKPFVFPSEADLSPDALVETYLAQTPFDAFFSTPVPFVIAKDKWVTHGIAVAPTGHGKSQLIGSIVYNFLQEDDPPGLCIVDPAGDMANELISLDHKHRDRVLVLDPASNPPDLNFFELGTSEADAIKSFDYLMSALSGGLSDKQGVASQYLLRLLRAVPNPTLVTLREIVGERVKAAQKSDFWPFMQRLEPIDRAYFVEQFYGPHIQITKDAIGWKLFGALATPAFRKMFSAASNSFDAFKAMQNKSIVIVKGGQAALGDHGMPIFLQFIVAQYYAAALKRENVPKHERHLCLMFVDEAAHVFNPQIAKILNETRKYGLGLFAATQVLHQIPTEVKASVYGATSIKMAGPVSHDDAVQLGKEMYCATDFIRSMQAFGHFAVHVKGVTDRAVELAIAYGTLENAAKVRPLAPAEPAAAGATEPPSAGSEPESTFDIKPGKDW